jgi:hypothetical protein
MAVWNRVWSWRMGIGKRVRMRRRRCMGLRVVSRRTMLSELAELSTWSSDLYFLLPFHESFMISNLILIPFSKVLKGRVEDPPAGRERG